MFGMIYGEPASLADASAIPIPLVPLSRKRSQEINVSFSFTTTLPLRSFLRHISTASS